MGREGRETEEGQMEERCAKHLQLPKIGLELMLSNDVFSHFSGNIQQHVRLNSSDTETNDTSELTICVKYYSEGRFRSLNSLFQKSISASCEHIFHYVTFQTVVFTFTASIKTLSAIPCHQLLISLFFFTTSNVKLTHTTHRHREKESTRERGWERETERERERAGETGGYIHLGWLECVLGPGLWFTCCPWLL